MKRIVIKWSEGDIHKEKEIDLTESEFRALLIIAEKNYDKKRPAYDEEVGPFPKGLIGEILKKQKSPWNEELPTVDTSAARRTAEEAMARYRKLEEKYEKNRNLTRPYVVGFDPYQSREKELFKNPFYSIVEKRGRNEYERIVAVYKSPPPKVDIDKIKRELRHPEWPNFGGFDAVKKPKSKAVILNPTNPEPEASTYDKNYCKKLNESNQQLSKAVDNRHLQLIDKMIYEMKNMLHVCDSLSQRDLIFIQSRGCGKTATMEKILKADFIKKYPLTPKESFSIESNVMWVRSKDNINTVSSRRYAFEWLVGKPEESLKKDHVIKKHPANED